MYSRSSSSKMIVVLLTVCSFGDKIRPPCYTYYALRHILYVSYFGYLSFRSNSDFEILIQMRQH